MLKIWSIVLAFILTGATAFSQGNPADTSIASKDIPVIDTSLNYDELFQDFDAFMDSILSPHSYFISSLAMTSGYYNFESKTSRAIVAEKKLTYSPTLGYYDKSGWGITGTGYIVDDGENMNFYQGALTGSLDHLKNRAFAIGASYTRYFTKKTLPFYTTPLQNELYGYFTYRKSWVKPMIAVSYGWGSRTDVERREELLTEIRLKKNGFTFINTQETINDFTLLASLRHDFYWLDVFTFKDHIRFTPQVSFSGGTQRFGFNQSSNTYGRLVGNNSIVLYSTENVFLDDQIKFQPISLTTFLRGEYSIGKFFIQPQLAMDYYFPAESKNFSAVFSLNIGCMF